MFGIQLQIYRIMLDGLFSEGDIHKACAFMEEMLQVFMSMLFDI